MMYILTAMIFGGAYLFQSVFGFGASLIAILGLSVIMPMPTAVAMVPFTILIGCVLIILSAPKSVMLMPILKLFIKALPGLVVGGFMLEILPGKVMVGIAASIILLYSLYSLCCGEPEIPRYLELPLALLAGCTISITGLGILFVPLVMQRIEEPDRLRVSLNFLWFCLGTARIPLYLLSGLITSNVLLLSAASIPAILIALFAGSAISSRIDAKRYRSGVLLLLAMIASLRISMLFF